jgi:hypothetical protein
MSGESYLIESPCRSPIILAAGFPLAKFAEIAEELERQFNGVTVYDRKPASGKTRHSTDDIIFEVMTADLDHAWRSSYRA